MKRGLFGRLAGSGIRAIVDRALNLKEALPLGRNERPTEAQRPEPRRAMSEHAVIDEARAPELHRDGEIIRWKIPSASIERAQALLGRAKDQAALELAIIVLTADDEARIERHEESFVIEPRGERALPERPSGAKSLASIGLAASGRFVSIVHLAIDD